MRCHVSIGAIDGWFIKAGLGHARFQIVRDHLRRGAAKEREGADMRGNPVWQALRPGRLDIGVTGCTQRGDEDLRRPYLAGFCADDIKSCPGIVDEQAFPGNMVLAHHRREVAFPTTIKFAIAAVAITLVVDAAILLPQQRKCHAFAPQLDMDLRPIRLRESSTQHLNRRREEEALQVALGQFNWQRPSQSRRLRTIRVGRNCASGNPKARGNLAGRKTLRSKPHHILDLAHRQSFHGVPCSSKSRRLPRVTIAQHRQIIGGNRVATCPGIPGHIRLEPVARSDRDNRPDHPGIRSC